MIKLENIAIINANRYFYSKSVYFYSIIRPMKKEEFAFLEKNNIRNFQELENAMGENVEVPSYFIELYKLVKNEVENCFLDRKPQIYCSKYEDYYTLDKDSVIRTEKEIKCNCLILENFLTQSYPTETYKIIKKINVEELRYLLLHCSPNGFNSLTLFPYIDNKKIELLINALRLFEEQLVRQAINVDSKNINLFLLNYEEKRKIVEAELNNFLEYFLNMPNIKRFVWGNRNIIGDKIMTRIIDDIEVRQHKCYENETFINYMTLEELERGAIENHTLDRFILEKSPSKSVK